MDVGFVLVFVLTHQEQHRRVARLVQDRLTHVDSGQREVLQLFLQDGHLNYWSPPSLLSLQNLLLLAYVHSHLRVGV